MVKYLFPRRVSAHREAAIALYRTLLSQSRASPLSDNQKFEIQNVIRNRFKQRTHETSYRWLKLGFKGAYEVVDHLDASIAGDETSTVYLTSLLDKVPSTLKQTPITPAKPAKKDGEDRSKIVKRSILDRPLPLDQLSGRRHVPRLANANGIPMLRIKKPQPPGLSGYIKQRLKKKRARLELYRDMRDDDLVLAEAEDEWDVMMEQQRPGSPQEIEQQHETGQEPSWAVDARKGLDHLRQWLHDEALSRKHMAEKMQDIIDQERALLGKEKMERRAKRKIELKAERRAARDAAIHNLDNSNNDTS